MSKPSTRHSLETLFMVIGVFALLAGCTSAPSTQGANPIPPQATQPPAPAATKPPASTATKPPVPVASPPAVAAPVDVCSLVTKQEVEAAIGGSVGDPTPASFPPIFSCDYRTANTDKISIIVTDFGTAKTAADAFQMAMDINKYPEVDGIGDRAMRPAILDIDVLKGQYDLSVGISMALDEESRYQIARKLAEIALTRLP